MSHLATWQGKPRVGIDHAVAAAAWAEQSGSPYARAYAADVAVRALTADGQADRSKDTLDREFAALQAALTDTGPRRSWWYFYDESFFWSQLNYAATAAEAAADAELIVVGTGWPEFGALDPYVIADSVAARTLLDTRGVISGQRWRAAGWTVHGLGHQSDRGAAGSRAVPRLPRAAVHLRALRRTVAMPALQGHAPNVLRRRHPGNGGVHVVLSRPGQPVPRALAARGDLGTVRRLMCGVE